MAPRSVQCRFFRGSGNTPAQERSGCRGARMRSQDWRACIALALFRSLQHGEWVSTERGAARAARELWLQRGDAARWCRRQRHRAVQGARACALPQLHCTRRGLVFSDYLDALTLENLHILWTIGQQVLFVVRGDSVSTMVAIHPATHHDCQNGHPVISESRDRGPSRSTAEL